MPSFTRQTTITASTLRNPATAGSKRGAPAPHLAELQITPLDPLGEMAPELKQRISPQSTPHELHQTFTEAEDIREGDVLVIAGKEYPIRAVDDWAWRRITYRRLIVEDLKR